MYRILFVLLVTICISGCYLKKKLSKSNPPNIVIIMTDDQGWGDLSINGNLDIQTPNIDKLALEGVRFKNFYVSPVCSPTRAEFLTGRYHIRTGVYSTTEGGERINLDEKTIADVFKEAGYTTAAYGKWHNGMQYPYHPNGRGFDDFYGFCSGHWGNYFNPVLEHNGKIIRGNGFIIDDLTKYGINFIEKNKNKPFLLYLPYNTPHSPMQVPDKWYKKYKHKDITQKGTNLAKENIPFTKAALAMCENIDWNVGRIQSKIKELGIDDNTIIVYLSDNGPNNWRWNDGMKGIKSSTDEGGVRSPLFIKWKGKIDKGLQIETIAGAIDLLPTLADLASIDLKVDKPLDGISLKNTIFNKKNNKARSRSIFNYWKGRLSVRNQKFRLSNNGQLFDIENDREQKNNVSNKFLEVKEKLSQAAIHFREIAEAELPINDSRTFPLGHPDFKYTHIPARDGVAYGNIKRSNKFPNCSFFTNWISVEDEIIWNIEVVESGNFKVTLYYTCPEGDEGASFKLTQGNNVLKAQILEPHDPPLEGMEKDRVKRENSYVKDFKPLNIGEIYLEKGISKLTLKALEIPGNSVMDIRLLMFERK
ncbi:arylsulfatase [uncultured Polaribacter sp.]|uniref:arylsulfatase n=1 Tax=uncultured Polaribacter sp. TaxID=174711 RepID=UPI0026130274|nr:arylsulfatase [uncultured Polaribacter sp.]